MADYICKSPFKAMLTERKTNDKNTLAFCSITVCSNWRFALRNWKLFAIGKSYTVQYKTTNTDWKIPFAKLWCFDLRLIEYLPWSCFYYFWYKMRLQPYRNLHVNSRNTHSQYTEIRSIFHILALCQLTAKCKLKLNNENQFGHFSLFLYYMIVFPVAHIHWKVESFGQKFNKTISNG